MKSKELRLLLSMGGSRKLLFGAIAGAVINTAIVIGNAFLIAAIIVGVIYSHPTVTSHIFSLALLWGFRAIFTSQFDRWASIEASALKAELRSQALSSSERVTAIPSSQLSTLLIKGANSLDIYLARFLPQIFGASVTPFAVMFAMALLDPISAVIAFLTLPLIPIFGALIGKFTNDAVTAKWKSLGTLSKYFEDSLRGIYTLAIFGRHKSQSGRIEEMGDRYTDETMKVLRISFLSALVLELAATISVALIAVTIGVRLVNSSMEFFPALAVLVLAPEVYLPLRNAATLFHASADGGAALSEIGEVNSKSSATTSGKVSITKVHSLQWKSWESPFGPGALDSYELKSGDVLILRGGSGLGKTTFLNSLLALNQSSSAMINGVSTREIDSSSLFRQVGWIPQSPSLISGSIRELFDLVKPGLTSSEIEVLLSKVGLDIALLPNGLETAIGGLGEKSGEISGGQKRRIAIARAIAINPSLIIADEPTADLDPTSAREILEALREEAENGAIVIAVLHAPDQSIAGAREVAMVER